MTFVNGNHPPVDAIINADGSVLLRAERSGKGDGRVDRVTFIASDSEGSSAGSVFGVVIWAGNVWH